MSKELEALAVLKQTIFHHTRGCLTIGEEKAFKVIETALKEHEELKQKHNELLYDYGELVHCGLKSEQKKIKAFEIIKKKDVNIKALKYWNKIYNGKLSYQNYLNILEDCDLGERLTQEEFNLLKEALL